MTQLIAAIAAVLFALAALIWAFRPHVPQVIATLGGMVESLRASSLKDKIFAEVHAKLMVSFAEQLSAHTACREQVDGLKLEQGKALDRIVDLERRLQAFVELSEFKDKIIEGLRREKAELEHLVDQLTPADPSTLHGPGPGFRSDDTGQINTQQKKDDK
jgi:hypothetical protein